MKLSLTTMAPSPEHDLLAETLKAFGDVHPVPAWSPESHTALFDMAVCVGPVAFCPPAKKKVLFVLGQTKNHLALDWDAVVVTSEKAKKLALQRFGFKTLIRVIPPPLMGLHFAKRRLVDAKRQLLHVSDGGLLLQGDVGILTLWGDLGFDRQDVPATCPQPEMFSLLEFNSRVKAGAIGFYPPCMEDGYDVQVRRHLALGGAVVCRRDSEVIGDLASLCADSYSDMLPEKVKPVACAGDESKYQKQVVDFVTRV